MSTEIRPSREGLAAVLVGALLLLLAWRRLFVDGQIPTDGNLITLSFPHWQLSRGFLSLLEWPLWNPWRNLGEPYLADPQTLVLYPPFWLLAPVRGFAAFMSLWVLGHSTLAGYFAWRWAREDRGDLAAAATAATIVALNGFFTARVTFPNHFAAAAWLPAVLYFQTRHRWVALGVSLALQWLAGFPSFALLTVLAVGTIACFQGRSGLVRLAKAGTLALGLAALQILPFLEMLSLSERGALLSGDAASQYSLSLPQLLKEIFLPQWFALAPETPGDPAILAFYIGPVALCAALWALLRGGVTERRVGLAVGLAALLSLGSTLPFYGLLKPFHLFRFPANWLLWSSAGLAWLAATGVARLPRTSWRWAAVAAIALDLLVFAQPVRTGWVEPGFFDNPPAWARELVNVHRVYHTREVRNLWIRGSLETGADYEAMREYLAPSFGAAFRIGEVRSYQVLSSRVSRDFEARLAKERSDSPLFDWANVSTIIAARPGATRVSSDGARIVQRRLRHGSVFVPEGGTARFVRDRPGDVTIDTSLEKPGRVVLSQTALPGWRATIDGETAEIEPFAETFLAATVPAGRHELRFEYHPQPFYIGLLLTTIALLFLCARGIRDLWRMATSRRRGGSSAGRRRSPARHAIAQAPDSNQDTS
jgi:hypothetical protein